MLKGKLEIVRFESASTDRDRWCSSNVIRQAVSYCRCGTTKARDPIFVWDEHGSSCLSSAEDLSARRKSCSRYGISDMSVHRTPGVFVRQSGDLIVYSPLDRKPMKFLQSIGDVDASPLTCDNASGRVLCKR